MSKCDVRTNKLPFVFLVTLIYTVTAREPKRSGGKDFLPPYTTCLIVSSALRVTECYILLAPTFATE